MGLISSLKRCEEDATPSRPLLFTTTAVPVMADTLMPAMNAFVWVPTVPMRMAAESAATPRVPISMLLLPVVRLLPALEPNPMLFEPVLFRSAWKPSAVLSWPMVLFWSARKPLAVLLKPVALLKSALRPFAVLLLPVGLLKSALTPLAVLSLPVALLRSALTPMAVLSL